MENTNTSVGSVTNSTGSASLTFNGLIGVQNTLGISRVTSSNVADGTYEFTLQKIPHDNTTALQNYFGNMGGNVPYYNQITSEINGTKPFFFLNISGSTVSIYDGFQRGLNSSSTAPLVISDDYPAGTYTYTGTLHGSNSAADLPITITMTITDPMAWSINGASVITGSSNPTLTFSVPSGPIGAGTSVSVTATATVKDIGSTTITGWSLTGIAYPLVGSGWSLSVGPQSSLTSGNSETLTFTLTGTAPTASSTIDFSQLQFTLTPTGN